MSTGSSNNLNGDAETNKAKHDATNNEESSHLLEASENGAKYGSRQAVKIVKANASDSANASLQVKPKNKKNYILKSLLTGAGTKNISIYLSSSLSLTHTCPHFICVSLQCLTLTE